MTAAAIPSVFPDISRAERIPGWMSAQELTWLALEARKRWRIVEVGSFVGRSTRVLAENTPGWVAALDDWKGPRNFKVYPEMTDAQEAQARMDFYSIFRSNLDDLIDRQKVHVIRASHRNPVRWNGPGPDMVFIDGSHEYEDVKHDILTWRSILVEGGLLCGHDFAVGKDGFPGVVQAVTELCAGFKRPSGTTIWVEEPCW